MKKGNLLIVEDDIDLAKDLSRYLENHADHIYITHEGTRGLQVIGREPIHCVICDIGLKDMTGLELMKQAREDGVQIPFIFFTGNNSETLKKEIHQFDRTVILIKPDISGLVAFTDQMLKKGFEERQHKHYFSFIR